MGNFDLRHRQYVLKIRKNTQVLVKPSVLKFFYFISKNGNVSQLEVVWRLLAAMSLFIIEDIVSAVGWSVLALNTVIRLPLPNPLQLALALTVCVIGTLFY